MTTFQAYDVQTIGSGLLSLARAIIAGMLCFRLPSNFLIESRILISLLSALISSNEPAIVRLHEKERLERDQMGEG